MFRSAWLLLALLFPLTLPAQEEGTAAARRLRNRQFESAAQQRTGLLIPMYIYPADIETNPAYNRLIDLKRRYETVPFRVIVNPASGPGTRVDPNYTRAIDRLIGAGCTVIGYVSTDYAKRPAEEIQEDIDRWVAFYPRVHGLFFDEMNYEDRDAAVDFQLSLKEAGERSGFWPIVANPGTDTPGRFFAAEAADCFVVHEGETWPDERKIQGDRPGGYGDFPPWTRAVLVHSTTRFDKNSLHVVRRYARWVYVTEDPYRPGREGEENPWDTLSRHMEAMCEELAR